MIVADTSALIAIALAEPERDIFMAVLKRSDVVLISSASVVEARIVLYRKRGATMVALLNQLFQMPQIQIVEPTGDQLDAAHAAFVTYGKGSGHPAQLNFGDLFAYALAKTRNLPLLFKGDDFTRTDLLSASAAKGAAEG